MGHLARYSGFLVSPARAWIGTTSSSTPLILAAARDWGERRSQYDVLRASQAYLCCSPC